MTTETKPEAVVPEVFAAAAPAAGAASDPVTAIANVVGIALGTVSEELATRATREVTRIRKRKSEIKAELVRQRSLLPNWDASKVMALFAERDKLDDDEDALMISANLELMRAKGN